MERKLILTWTVVIDRRELSPTNTTAPFRQSTQTPLRGRFERNRHPIGLIPLRVAHEFVVQRVSPPPCSIAGRNSRKFATHPTVPCGAVVTFHSDILAAHEHGPGAVEGPGRVTS